MSKSLLLLVLCFIGWNTFSQLMTPTQVVSIPMRDGKSLAADVYIPSGCTDCPTILIQTPYNKNLFRIGLPLGTVQNINASPYVWVVVDWRGFYGSASAAVSQANRGEDGYDVIEWISAQSWSNQKVGTWGPSALGVIQYQTMREQHPNHICAVPIVAHPQTHYEGYYYGGALEKARLEQLDNLGYGLSPFVLGNPYYSNIWQFAENNSWYPGSIQIPTLQIGGWYDHNIDRMMDWYKATRQQAVTNVQDEQYLLVGPWVHGGFGTANVGSGQQGELSYPNAAFKSDSMARDFFAYYLRNVSNGWNQQAQVTYYETGKNTWNTSNANDLTATGNTTLFLNQNEQLGLQTGTGTSLLDNVDPRTPTPTIGGQTLHPDLEQGPYDQVSLLNRNDVAFFQTGILYDDVSISGRVACSLYVQSTQPDGDLVVRLLDIYPDGRHMLINDGIKRIRFRNGTTQANEALLTPGTVVPVEVKLPFVNFTWKEGHKIGMIVSGNSSYRWDVNLQNGSTMYQAGDTNVADITIHHTSLYPSKIVLPGSNPSLGSEELALVELAIYPNPSAGEWTISGIGSEDEWNVFTTMGQLITSGKGQKVDLKQVSAGTYVIQVNTQNQTITQLLMKNQ